MMLPNEPTAASARLGELGFDEPAVQDIPAEFTTDAWFREARTGAVV